MNAASPASGDALWPAETAVYTIQTNGTKLDAEWAAFFREHDVLVGISIAGPREIHERTTARSARGRSGRRPTRVQVPLLGQA